SRLALEHDYSSLSASVMSLEPFAAPSLECPVHDVRARLLAEPDEKADVVQRDQPQAEHVLDHEQMPEVAARIRGARLAVALGVERLDRAFESGPPHVDPAGGQPSGPVAAVPGSGDAVEQVNATRDALQQIGGEADTHKITGHFRGKGGAEIFEDAV